MPVTNELDALSIMDTAFAGGGVRDASVPATGNNASGTNNTPALAAMLAAAQPGQLCVIPYGNFRFSSGVTINDKRVNILILGNTYIDTGVTLFTVSPRTTGGDYLKHRIVHMGEAYGRVNTPAYTRTAFLNGTGPVWTDFTSHLVKIVNVNQVVVETNRCEGFKSPVLLEGGPSGLGGQENTITGRFWYKNAYGVYMRSVGGSSYMDKNVITGPEDGTLRISCGTGIFIDGDAANGNTGAFRSNKIRCLIEQCERIADCQGDITEPEFDITIEGGPGGVYSSDPVGLLTNPSSSKYVRNPVWHGRGIMYIERLGTNGNTYGSMGRSATIEVPIYKGDSTVYYGKKAHSDNSGTVYIEASYVVTKSQRDAAIAANSFVRFVPAADREDDVNITASYPVPYGVRWIHANGSGITVTLPAVANSCVRYVTVFNTNATAAVTVASTAFKTGSTTSIAANKSKTYFCDGVNWWDAD